MVGNPQTRQLKVTYMLWNENSLFGGNASLSELPPLLFILPLPQGPLGGCQGKHMQLCDSVRASLLHPSPGPCCGMAGPARSLARCVGPGQLMGHASTHC